MKTQCSNCKNEQEIPDIYSGKEIKCQKCQKPFIAKKYEEIITAKQKPIETQLPKRFTMPLPNGTWLSILGGLCMIFSIFSFIENFIDESNIGILGSAVCFLLSIIICGIGSIIEAINANTRNR